MKEEIEYFESLKGMKKLIIFKKDGYTIYNGHYN